MANTTKAQVANPEANVEVQANVEPQVSAYRAIIKQLVADGAKRINGVRVKNVNVTELDNYVRVALTLSNPVTGFVHDESTDTWSKGQTNVVFVSLYGLTAMFKEQDELAWCANHILEHPEVLNMILCGSNITLLQREYEAGDEVRNPFSTRTDAEGTTYDHDIIVNDIIDVELGKTAERMLDRLADKMLGF